MQRVGKEALEAQVAVYIEIKWVAGGVVHVGRLYVFV